jgi:hypothetical protein
MRKLWRGFFLVVAVASRASAKEVGTVAQIASAGDWILADRNDWLLARKNEIAAASESYAY